MSDLMKEMEKDQESFASNTDNIQQLASKCQEMLDLDKLIADKEAELKELETRRDVISSEVIPNLLSEQGLASLNMIDGSKVEVKKKYSCTVKADPELKEKAHDWLRNEGLGDIIKNNVAVSFGTGEDNKAEEFFGLAASSGYEPEQSQKVEPSTLRALFRERVQNGLDMPSDLFNIFIKDETKITRKK